MATENVFVTSDTTDLVRAPKSTADAILDNVSTTVHLKSGQPAAPALEMGDYIESDLDAKRVPISLDSLIGLYAVATGQLTHVNMGSCPDILEGAQIRDAECPACQLLLAADAELRNSGVILKDFLASASAGNQIIERGMEACESEHGLHSPTLQEKMKFKTLSGSDLELDLRDIRHTLILGGDAQSFSFNPLEAARKSPEFMVQMLEQSAGVKLNDAKKTVMLTILANLPEGATMRDLYEAIQLEEATSIGIKPEQYEALAPLLEALGRMQAEGVHAHLFDQRSKA
ncbi:hypothetical protein [Pseudomonas psychrophila]|uniref:Uncharacterized protein n=1 Tax=Pseudomonas psychrophila TaxID=122355 RepID=A0A8I1FXT2_9PSED|nr:hypothetical protein [Pseudomonas psychrophila]MBJ2259190.1 hypothetical protein [Pseudomonas psychrophila]